MVRRGRGMPVRYGTGRVLVQAGHATELATGTAAGEARARARRSARAAAVPLLSRPGLGHNVRRPVSQSASANPDYLKRDSTPSMKLSARNQVPARVTSVTRGEATANVELQANGIRLVASITVEALAELGLAVGSEVVAVVKASDVILAVAADRPGLTRRPPVSPGQRPRASRRRWASGPAPPGRPRGAGPSGPRGRAAGLRQPPAVHRLDHLKVGLDLRLGAARPDHYPPARQPVGQHVRGRQLAGAAGQVAHRADRQARRMPPAASPAAAP